MCLNKARVRGSLALLLSAVCAPLLHGEDRQIDPTWLYRNTETVPEKQSDVTTATCHYKPLFGEGDADRSIVVGGARYSEVTVDAHGACAAVEYPGEDQVYVVLSGTGSAEYGSQDVPLKTEDYLYLPATVRHTGGDRLADGAASCRDPPLSRRPGGLVLP